MSESGKWILENCQETSDGKLEVNLASIYLQKGRTMYYKYRLSAMNLGIKIKGES